MPRERDEADDERDDHQGQLREKEDAEAKIIDGWAAEEDADGGAERRGRHDRAYGAGAFRRGISAGRDGEPRRDREPAAKASERAGKDELEHRARESGP